MKSRSTSLADLLNKPEFESMNSIIELKNVYYNHYNCTKCHKFPFIKICKSMKNVKLTCSCFNNKKISIEELLKIIDFNEKSVNFLLETNSNINIENHIICNEHNKKFKGFSKFFLNNYCEDCFNYKDEIYNNDIIEFDEMKIEEMKIRKIFEKIDDNKDISDKISDKTINNNELINDFDRNSLDNKDISEEISDKTVNNNELINNIDRNSLDNKDIYEEISEISYKTSNNELIINIDRDYSLYEEKIRFKKLIDINSKI